MQRKLSLESETTQVLGGPYRRGATIDSNMGLTPPTSARKPPSPALESSPAASIPENADESLSSEIHKVSKQLETELNLEKKSGKAEPEDDMEGNNPKPKKKAKTTEATGHDQILSFWD